jgi:hypothetical protein
VQRDDAYNTHDRALEFLRTRYVADKTLESAKDSEDIQIAIAVEEIGDGETRVVLRVQTDNEATWRAIDEMRGAGVVPKDAQVEYIGRMYGLGPQDAVSPIQPGVSCAPEIGPSGTIGCFARRGDVPFLVSANHVIAQENNGVVGADGVVQPLAGAFGVRTIAVLHDFEPLSTVGGNAMDGAIARLTINDIDPRLFSGRRIATVRPTTTLVSGNRVFKFGQMSGEREGIVLSTISNISLEMRFGTYAFDLHIEVSSPADRPFSIAGDSGALVYDEMDRAVGILIGGNQSTRSYVTPIERVLGRFELTLM